MFNFYKIWLQRTTAVLLSMIICSLLKQMLNASLTFFLKKKKCFHWVSCQKSPQGFRKNDSIHN